jgi:hypothetical protein
VGGMSILSWAKPPRAMPAEEWKAISADSAPPGVYVPNMSDEDAYRWRAKKIGGQDPRVEIRKTVTGQVRKRKYGEYATYAQILLIVRPDGSVNVSMNGTADFSRTESDEMFAAVAEAREVLAQMVHASQTRHGRWDDSGHVPPG